MTYSRSIVSFALLATLVTGIAFAQDAAPSANDSGAPEFSTLNDGKPITRSQVPKGNDSLKELRAHFDEADKNHDGRVDASEYNAYVNKGNTRQPQQH
jgi:hypothetical protein